MSPTKINNVHERRLAARPERVWDLLLKISGPDDQLWPSGVPTVRLDGPLAEGAIGGHGPIRYEVTRVDPKARDLVFRFREPTGLVGHHSFHVRPDGKAGALLRHEVVATPEGWMRMRWPLIVRWIHDTVVEEVMDRAEVATGNAPIRSHQRSRWVKILLALGAPRPRAEAVLLSSSACQSLTRVDWADAYRMALRPHVSQDPEVWRKVISDLSSRSRLLRLRIAGGDVLRRWTGAPKLGPEGAFPVLGRTPNEVLVGLDDGHLNFRASLGIDSRTDGRTDLVVTTAVMFHNAWGRRYLSIIKPFHRRLVTRGMRQAARLVTSSPTPALNTNPDGPSPAAAHQPEGALSA